ncbi:MAG: hypothetical protein QXP36_07485 [Conexivisphaerales archaeon]
MKKGNGKNPQGSYRRYSIDLDNKNKNILKHILKVLMDHKSIVLLKWRKSARKGFHIYYICKKNKCKVCSRLKRKYDDKERYYKDKKYRKYYERDILFYKKTYVNGKKVTIRYAGSWHILKI